ncbi:hypothetical protein E4T56_gene10890 [Termitomyces sp. T112]|nr:hypothetical protein E4T56_gene10890 [Termitomyces sp. T112]
MSSGTSTTFTLSQLPSISTSGSGGNDGTSRSASYFFGFLVTFAVLLMLFVVAGFVSRHRMRARRHAATIESGIGAGDPWVYGYHQRRMCEETKKIKPVWMERWFEDPVTNEKAKRAGVDSHIGWGDIMPLSATITRVEHEEKVDEGVGEEENIVRRISTSTISSWLSSLSTSKHTDGDMGPSPSHLAIQDATHDPEVGVDVVVMIAMPRSLDTWGYEFGVTNVPIVSQSVNTDNVT